MPKGQFVAGVTAGMVSITWDGAVRKLRVSMLCRHRSTIRARQFVHDTVLEEFLARVGDPSPSKALQAGPDARRGIVDQGDDLAGDLSPGVWQEPLPLPGRSAAKPSDVTREISCRLVTSKADGAERVSRRPAASRATRVMQSMWVSSGGCLAASPGAAGIRAHSVKRTRHRQASKNSSS